MASLVDVCGRAEPEPEHRGLTQSRAPRPETGRPAVLIRAVAPRVKMSNRPIEFQVLGPTEARQGGRAIQLSGARRRALVTRLLLDAGRGRLGGHLA